VITENKLISQLMKVGSVLQRCLWKRLYILIKIIFALYVLHVHA